MECRPGLRPGDSFPPAQRAGLQCLSGRRKTNLNNTIGPPRRLRRLDQIYRSTGCPTFFVTICTHRRRKLLDNVSVLGAFREFCSQSWERGHFTVGKYVLMPDHIHVFVACEDSGKLSAWVKALKGTLSSLFRRRRLGAPFWQEGFFDHLLRSNESYDEKWLYMARNPVRAKLVEHEDDWPFGGEIHSLD